MSFLQKTHFLSRNSILFHLPTSTGNLWFRVRNVNNNFDSLSVNFLKYVSNLKVVLNNLYCVDSFTFDVRSFMKISFNFLFQMILTN